MVIAGALVTPNLFGQTLEEARNIRKYVSTTRKMAVASGDVRAMMRDASVPWKTAESELAKYLHQPSDLAPVDFVKANQAPRRPPPPATSLQPLPGGESYSRVSASKSSPSPASSPAS